MARPRRTLSPRTPGEVTKEPESDSQPATDAVSNLPRAADIDPATIARPVLTADGWVVPSPVKKEA